MTDRHKEKENNRWLRTRRNFLRTTRIMGGITLVLLLHDHTNSREKRIVQTPIEEMHASPYREILYDPTTIPQLKAVIDATSKKWCNTSEAIESQHGFKILSLDPIQSRESLLSAYSQYHSTLEEVLDKQVNMPEIILHERRTNVDSPASFDGKKIHLYSFFDNTEDQTLWKMLAFVHEVAHSQDNNIVYDRFISEGFAVSVSYATMEQSYIERGYASNYNDVMTRQIVDLITTYESVCKHNSIQCPKIDFASCTPPVLMINGGLHTPEYQEAFSLVSLRSHQWQDDLIDDMLKGDYCKLMHEPENSTCD